MKKMILCITCVVLNFCQLSFAECTTTFETDTYDGPDASNFLPPLSMYDPDSLVPFWYQGQPLNDQQSMAKDKPDVESLTLTYEVFTPSADGGQQGQSQGGARCQPGARLIRMFYFLAKSTPNWWNGKWGLAWDFQKSFDPEILGWTVKTFAIEMNKRYAGNQVEGDFATYYSSKYTAYADKMEELKKIVRDSWGVFPPPTAIGVGQANGQLYGNTWRAQKDIVGHDLENKKVVTTLKAESTRIDSQEFAAGFTWKNRIEVDLDLYKGGSGTGYDYKYHGDSMYGGFQSNSKIIGIEKEMGGSNPAPFGFVTGGGFSENFNFVVQSLER